jgi:hypothetical protein
VVKEISYFVGSIPIFAAKIWRIAHWGQNKNAGLARSRNDFLARVLGAQLPFIRVVLVGSKPLLATDYVVIDDSYFASG